MLPHLRWASSAVAAQQRVGDPQGPRPAAAALQAHTRKYAEPVAPRGARKRHGERDTALGARHVHSMTHYILQTQMR